MKKEKGQANSADVAKKRKVRRGETFRREPAIRIRQLSILSGSNDALQTFFTLWYHAPQSLCEARVYMAHFAVIGTAEAVL